MELVFATARLKRVFSELCTDKSEREKEVGKGERGRESI
jgi:hypothetical protein